MADTENKPDKNKEGFIGLVLREKKELFNDFAGQDLIDILEKFTEENHLRSCPMCGRGDWEYFPPAAGGVTGLHLFSLDKEGVELTQFVPTLQLVCLHCGFLRSHSTIILHNWWKSNLATKVGNNE